MNNLFGQSGWGQNKTTYTPLQYPTYTQTFYGSQDECYTSASILYNKGWTVNVTSGNPYVLEASIHCELDSDNQTPLSTTGSYITINWSFRTNTCQKELLHCNTWELIGNNNNARWLGYMNDQDKLALENVIANPNATTPAGLYLVNTSSHTLDFTITGAGAWSGNNTSSNAAQVVWKMNKFGQKTLPVYQPSLRLTMEVPSTFDLSFFFSNIGRYYTKSALNSVLGIPTGFYNGMPQDTDPSSTDTDGITYYYGWMKEPCEAQQNGTTITVNQEYSYGLWSSNVFGTRIS